MRRVLDGVSSIVSGSSGTASLPSPRSTQHTATTSHTDEELARTRERLNQVEARERSALTQLHELRSAENDALKELKTTRNDLEVTTTQARSLESAHRELYAHHNQLLGNYSNLENSYAQLTRQMDSLKQERAQHVAENARLRVQVEAHDQAVAARMERMNVFDNTLDQVSEAEVKDHGPSSVARLNDLLDELVAELIEAAKLICQPVPDNESATAAFNSNLNEPLLSSLAFRVREEEHKELLLDACLHGLVIKHVHAQFFAGNVATCNVQSAHNLEALYNKVDETGKKPSCKEFLDSSHPPSTESWTVSQRWRALAASAFANCIQIGDEDSNVLASLLITALTLAYRIDSQLLRGLHAKAAEGLLKLCRMAHELSLTVKRDIISVRMAVTVPSALAFDHRRMEALWGDMGVVDGDTIIGGYAFGLSKLNAGDPQEIIMLRPKAITSALLRYVAVDAPNLKGRR